METVKLDTATMPSTSVLVRMLAAPIAPVDLAQVAGSASFPSSGGRVCGNEGVGVVEEAGSGSGLVKGSIVVPNTGGLGTWATHVISPGASWTAVPDSVAKGAIEPVAAGVAPYLAAKHLLEGFVKLGKGEWGKGEAAGSSRKVSQKESGARAYGIIPHARVFYCAVSAALLT